MACPLGGHARRVVRSSGRNPDAPGRRGQPTGCGRSNHPREGGAMASGTIERKCRKATRRPRAGAHPAACAGTPGSSTPPPTAGAGSTTWAATPPELRHERCSTRRSGARATTRTATVQTTQAIRALALVGQRRRSTSCWATGSPTCKPTRHSGCAPSAATANSLSTTSAPTSAPCPSARSGPSTSNGCTTSWPRTAARTASRAG
jgi:hypothetical protein